MPSSEIRRSRGGREEREGGENRRVRLGSVGEDVGLGEEEDVGVEGDAVVDSGSVAVVLFLDLLAFCLKL